MVKKSFTSVLGHRFKRNPFNLDHSYKTTVDSGLLVPICALETIPGDKFNLATGIELRSMPLVSPLMHQLNLDVRYFYVPNRIIWNGWQEYMMDKNSHVHPFYLNDNPGHVDYDIGTLANYFGIPTGCPEPINVLPFRAYWMIWNEYFRDQNLQDTQDIDLGDGAETSGIVSMAPGRVCWKKDYFTSALPWPQAGVDVQMGQLVKLVDQGWDQSLNPPLAEGRTQRIISTHEGPETATPALGNHRRVLSLDTPGSTPPVIDTDIDGNLFAGTGSGSSLSSQGAFSALIDPNGTWFSEFSIRELREGSAVQRFLERSAMVGSSRYADWMRGIFGVNIGDDSLQRPMYLGGGSSQINVSPVEQTSATSNVTPQGNLAGKGYLLSGYRFNRPTSFAEHGWIIGVAFIRPEAVYMDGLDRKWSKNNRFDYLIPGFEFIGEQEILNKEVLCLQSSATSYEQQNNGTFGYQERYAEFKWAKSIITGHLKTDLSSYVQPRVLGDNGTQSSQSVPLNDDFVSCVPYEDNNFAVSTKGDHYILNCYHSCKALRPLSYFPNYKL